jgi:hypothetical protein
VSPRLPQQNGVPVVDVRGPRFSATLTMAVLAIALIVQGPVGTVLVAWQVTAFAIAAIAGLAWSPYGNLFRLLKRRLGLGPPPATEPEAPPRFAQACGLAVAGAGLVALLVGATTLGWVLVAVVLALSALLSLTGICIGCEMYLLIARLRHDTRTA